MEEAAANAVEHAYGPVDGPVSVHLTFEAPTVVATVRDHGHWRDPRGVHRGRGTMLMSALVDRMETEHLDPGTRVTLRKTPERNGPMTEATSEVEDTDETLRVALRGEIDMVNVGIVDSDLRALISNRHTDVVLDLAELHHLDSSGLRMLFSLRTRLEVLQIRFHLQVPLDAPTRRVIELSGIAGLASLQPESRSSS